MRPFKKCRLETDKVADVIRQLKAGEIEVAIVDTDLLLECPGKEMVAYWNARVKPEFRVPVPKRWSDLNFKDYKWLPGLANGMWHLYASTAHDRALDSPVVDYIFTETTGTPDWKVRPNRFRFNPVHKDDGYKTAHLEGPNVLSDKTGISAIFCVTAGRTFTYYKGSNNDPRARKLFEDLGGRSSLFVQPTQEQLKHWPRTTIATTRPGQIILFADSVAHEISRLGKNSISLFLSPYNPQESTDNSDFYAGLNRKQAIAKRKATKGAPPLPPAYLSEGQQRQHPEEFRRMSRRETEIFGSLFNISGAYWPSDKPTFFLMHMMAFNAFKHKFLPFCFDSEGKFNYEVITPGLVAGCDDFDWSYFRGLPFFDITDQEIEEMKRKFTGIPAAAWPLVRYWTKDVRQVSRQVCIRRGYIN